MSDLRTKAFRLWFKVSRAMTLGVRGVVEDEAGRVLLVRHTYTPGLHFPGGGVEAAEPAQTALQRELQEEAGVGVTAPPDLHNVYSNHASFRNDHVLLYRVRAWRPVTAVDGGEIDEIVWIDASAPPQETSAGTVRRLNELYRGAAVSDFWRSASMTAVTVSST